MLASGWRHRCCLAAACLQLALNIHASLPGLSSMVANMTILSQQVCAESLADTTLGPLLIVSSC